MNKKQRLTIQNKMMISYCAIIVLLIVIGVFNIYYLSAVYNNGKEIYENDLKAVEYLKTISQNIKEIDSKVFHYIVDVEWEHDEKCTKEIDELILENEQMIDAYALLNINEKERSLYEVGKQEVLRYHEQI